MFRTCPEISKYWKCIIVFNENTANPSHSSVSSPNPKNGTLSSESMSKGPTPGGLKRPQWSII
jgi:hypothetical protein